MSSHALRRPPVRLNCAGTVVLVGRSTLTMSGSALLARIGAGDSDDAFLDRSPQNVQAVLEWCRNRVVATHLVPAHVLLAEAQFFAIEDLVAALQRPPQTFFVSPTFDSHETANAWLLKHAGRITACHQKAGSLQFLCYGQRRDGATRDTKTRAGGSTEPARSPCLLAS